MYGREKRVLLREYLQERLTKAALADKLGISRRIKMRAPDLEQEEEFIGG